MAERGPRFRALQERFGREIRIEFISAPPASIEVQLHRCVGVGPGWIDWVIERSVTIPYRVLEDRATDFMVALVADGLLSVERAAHLAAEEAAIPFLMD